MALRFSLFTKILLWFFLNLLVLIAVFYAAFSLQLRFAADSPLFAASNRLDRVARLIMDEMATADKADRPGILTRYSSVYKVDFSLYSTTGEHLAGPEERLPDEVRRHLGDMPMPLPMAGIPGMGLAPLKTPTRPIPFGPRLNPMKKIKTNNPTRYWVLVPILMFEPGRFEPMRAKLLAVSESIFGHGLYFDVTPWFIIVAAVFGLSVVLWFPFIRGLTGAIKQMTTAAQQIAEERFETRVDEKRSDELGRLGAAINRLAVRLSGFVNGQKRFLGDISHELNSPLARLHFALSILDGRVKAADRGYVADAQEEVRLMSHLVSELLDFARAGIKTTELTLVSTPLLPLVREVCSREASSCQVKVEVPEDIAVLAHTDLVARALANVLRNAVQYAEGPLTIMARRQHDEVKLTIDDCGPGVAPEALPRLFDPFYRLEPDRARSTGGTGLGLAIVKTCIEACGGTVSARNLSPSGLEISIVLRAG
jgi:two-component system, OmpR family, sensor histidine kinase CpxA